MLRGRGCWKQRVVFFSAHGRQGASSGGACNAFSQCRLFVTIGWARGWRCAHAGAEPSVIPTASCCRPGRHLVKTSSSMAGSSGRGARRRACRRRSPLDIWFKGWRARASRGPSGCCCPSGACRCASLLLLRGQLVAGSCLPACQAGLAGVAHTAADPSPSRQSLSALQPWTACPCQSHPPRSPAAGAAPPGAREQRSDAGGL